MSLAESRRTQEQEIQMPAPGTVEHLDHIVGLDTSDIATHEQLIAFLRSNEIAQSFSLLAALYARFPEEVRTSDVTSGQWLLDTRYLPCQTEESPSVRVVVSQTPSYETASLTIRGQSAKQQTADYNTYEITMPLSPGDVTLLGGLSLSKDHRSLLYAKLSKDMLRADSRSAAEIDAEPAAASGQLGPLAVKLYRSQVFNPRNGVDPSAFSEALRMAAGDLAFCIKQEAIFYEPKLGL